MKFFVDTADLNDIRDLAATGLVDGVTTNPSLVAKSGRKFLDAGLQVAAGVPLQCDEPADYRTFRVGLFGLEKLGNVDRTVGALEKALAKIAEPAAVR